ncbi:uncharacterized protein LOC130841394 [Hippopotamus amphibius kiboko]|uniref:uncharacterized protein LOC130841394 n=1 Tax=Hippopotamus amphibius kiboko TaxID=575201 RepID=UPI002598A640|nr:uncharacterized protein LOC130841394 [Hippopotamus amphibius kiboko]
MSCPPSAHSRTLLQTSGGRELGGRRARGQGRLERKDGGGERGSVESARPRRGGNSEDQNRVFRVWGSRGEPHLPASPPRMLSPPPLSPPPPPPLSPPPPPPPRAGLRCLVPSDAAPAAAAAAAAGFLLLHHVSGRVMRQYTVVRSRRTSAEYTARRLAVTGVDRRRTPLCDVPINQKISGGLKMNAVLTYIAVILLKPQQAIRMGLLLCCAAWNSE